ASPSSSVRGGPDRWQQRCTRSSSASNGAAGRTGVVGCTDSSEDAAPAGRAGRRPAQARSGRYRQMRPARQEDTQMSSDLSSPSTSAFEIRPSAHPRSLAQRRQALSDLAFGTVFTDHMARATWTAEDGWTDRRVEAYGPLSLDPAAAVLHYAQEIFEGLKAYRHEDGSVWAFRPEANAARFAASARRLALPELSEEDFLASIDALTRTDVEWVPSSPGSTLY